ncbi:NUDIX hydrolase [Oceanobacillus manasiensis]|uniref:NUDIX hydrolase n=1 Tax=Oceanobacillus manasiensis TaxID=586413 RepID=UPI0005A7B266|nr:NUDIX domain-containing protein [Oceanobacillus manasiensis]
MRNRGSAVLLRENKIALIKRIREGSTYYVFPGGGMEEGETPEQATKREVYEELGVQINIIRYIASLHYHGVQHYFLAEITEGEFGTGIGEEFTDLDRNRGIYKPMWVEANHLSSIDVRPKEMAEKVTNMLK